MYNVLKGHVVPQEENAKQIIDSNERMEKIIEQQMQRLEQLAEERRQEIIDEYLEHLQADEEDKPVIPMDDEGNPILPFDDEGNQLLYLHSDGFLYEEEEEIIEEEPEPEEVEPEEPPIDREQILAEIQQESDTILANANADAQNIVNDAQTQADAIRQEAEAIRQEAEQLKAQAVEEGRKEGHEEGYQTGYDEGKGKANEELAEQSAQLETDYANKAQALEAEKERIVSEYRKKEEELENHVVDVFCDIIGKVFGIEFADKKEIILHLVDNVITNTPGSKEYLIRINDSNFDILNQNRAKLIEKIGTGVELDIIKDPLLGTEECMIETDGGVYDCGIDVQLSNLLKDLKALSLV